eukprot:4187670-Pleurochrysis_carterae.AAC.1
MLVSSIGAETGCRSCTESPTPCASRCAVSARADASSTALLAQQCREVHPRALEGDGARAGSELARAGDLTSRRRPVG